MKLSKNVTIILVVAFLAVSWFSVLSSAIDTIRVVSNFVSKAEESVELGLYEQGIEYYNDAINERNSKKYYIRIKEIYDVFYGEEKTKSVRNSYINDMLVAAEKYPKENLFWNTAIKLQLEAQDYRDAYSTVKKAENFGASGKEFESYLKKITYMEKVDYSVYSELYTALNGYNVVSKGSNWFVIDNFGEKISDQYSYIGPINEAGYGVYYTGNEYRLLDEDEIVRCRYGNMDISRIGFYSNESQIYPALIGEKWSYINNEGKKVAGEYDIAGSFKEHSAVACKDGKWELITDDGKTTSLEKFSDIKLDLYGSYLQGDVIIAKENNKYHLYDKDFNKQSDFECDDIDICIDNGLIAFKSGGKWGFVNTKGKIIVEPKYKGAKSFSNGYAAICENNGLWGFINDKEEQVIAAKYMNAFYFNDDKTCFISKDNETYQLLRFMFKQ